MSAVLITTNAPVEAVDFDGSGSDFEGTWLTLLATECSPYVTRIGETLHLECSRPRRAFQVPEKWASDFIECLCRNGIGWTMGGVND